MRQKLFTIRATVSVLFCLTAATLWVRSDTGGDYFICQRGNRAFSLISDHGVVRWTGVRYTHGDPQSPFSVEHFSTGPRRLEWIRRLVAGVDDPLYGITGASDSTGRLGGGAGEGRFSEMHDVPPDGYIPPDFRFRYATTPHFLPVAATALLPAAWVCAPAPIAATISTGSVSSLRLRPPCDARSLSGMRIGDHF